MSALWIMPLVVIAVGLVAVTVALRTAAEAAVELRREVADLEVLRVAAADVRTGSNDMRARWDAIRANARVRRPRSTEPPVNS